MSSELLVTLHVNGQRHVLGVKPGMTLQKVLRDQLGLTGTKNGCEAGDCGACTVLKDGRAVASCLVLAVEAEGSRITTIEGLSEDGGLHPLQKSFIKHGALQCGFCTPGQIMSALALIQQNPDPSRGEIVAALGGNLCRCGSYTRIISAIQNWKDFENTEIDTEPHAGDERDQERDHSVVGHGVTRYDAPDKVSGRAIYTADIKLPGMIYGKVLRSPIPHGLIRSIDTSRAHKLPGVLAIITGEDVPDTWYGVSPARYDEQILAKERVRYLGDEVAAVAALDEDTALRALELIEVEYEELPAVFDPKEAMAPDAPLIHPEDPRYAENISTRVEWDFGDVEKGFEEADHIREERFVGNRTYQSPIEPHAAIARWEHHGRKLTVWSSSQVPHYMQHMISRVFNIPMGDIRMIRPAVGGGLRSQGGDHAAGILRRYPGPDDWQTGNDEVHTGGDVLPLPGSSQTVSGSEDRCKEGWDDHRRQIEGYPRRWRIHLFRGDHRLLRRGNAPHALQILQLFFRRPAGLYQPAGQRRHARARSSAAPFRLRIPARHNRRRSGNRSNRDPTS